MCGICGVVGIESREASEPVVRRMMAAMVHRGPDEEGLLIAPPVAAGMRRLSIVDLAGGSQPVWNDAGTLAIVYNGEVYNFLELRAELEAAGHRFRTRSDTEVVLRAYEAWGERSVERLHGMFAFAIVEMPQGRAGRAARVFLSRDRMGIKPLYYALVAGKLVFASEVRALLASGLVPARISAEAVRGYLLFGSVCEPQTLIEGVASLPPGHSISVVAQASVAALPAPKRYWDAPAQARESVPASETAQRTRELLEKAVEGHLIADVPVGVFLSGGLDSTAIAALASRARSGIHTFTVAFADADKNFSEAEIARRTAARLKTNHRELTLSGNEVLARIDEAIDGFDQPSMDGINTYFVSWAARQAGLKVALSGLGSDELFGGYGTFASTPKIARAAAITRALPGPLRAPVARMILRFAGSESSPDASRKALAGMRDPEALPHPYFFTRLLFAPENVAAAFGRSPSARVQSTSEQWLEAAADRSREMDDFTAVSWLELRSYMLNTLLRDTDAMSMRHSLEVRVPFLDAPLVDFVLSLPEKAKRPAPQPKSLLIAALRDVFPEEILGQRKRTFTFPWENWLRGALGERVGAGLAEWSPALEPVLPGEFARSVWRQYQAGETTWSRPWSLYVLNEWVKRNAGASNAGSAVSAGEPKSAAVAIS
jgi:asparagine synthase (glutamine-hydrolysing)